MTREDKLTKLIEIAVKNGWERDGFSAWVRTKNKYMRGDELLYAIIFQQDFAKAIWGDGIQAKEKDGICLCCGKPTKIVGSINGCNHVYWPEHSCPKCGQTKDWQYHLQQAVISDSPLEYYWENLQTKSKRP